jgi:hypothetical protein
MKNTYRILLFLIAFVGVRDAAAIGFGDCYSACIIVDDLFV